MRKVFRGNMLFSPAAVMLGLALMFAHAAGLHAQTVYKEGKAPAREGEAPLRVIMIGAHPDDAEIKGGGPRRAARAPNTWV